MAKKKEERTSTTTIIIAIIISLAIIGTVFYMLQKQDESSKKIQLVQQQYVQQVNTINADMKTMEQLVTAYNSAKDLNQLITSATNYANQYAIVENHINMYISFLDANNEVLSRYYGVNVYQEKQNVLDARIRYQQNMEGMKNQIQSITQQQKAQQEALGQLLKLLMTFGI